MGCKIRTTNKQKIYSLKGSRKTMLKNEGSHSDFLKINMLQNVNRSTIHPERYFANNPVG